MNRNKNHLIEMVHRNLVDKGMTVAVAESCTGGLLGVAFTERPGSSAYFLGGILAYSNSVKEELLGVSHKMLLSFGAVSEEVASEMALGIQRLTGSDWAVSTTGIAGPDGGTEEKPVGIIWVSVADSFGVFSQKLSLDGRRSEIRDRTVIEALSMLLERLSHDAAAL